MDELIAIFVILGIVVLVAGIYLNYYVAKQFENAANQKGHYGKRFFHLSFWLGIVGYLLIIALPDRPLSETKANVKITEIKEKSDDDVKYQELLNEFIPCENCGADVSQDSNVCHVCGSNLKH